MIHIILFLLTVYVLYLGIWLCRQSIDDMEQIVEDIEQEIDAELNNIEEEEREKKLNILRRRLKPREEPE